SPPGRPIWAIAVGAGLVGAALTAVTLIAVVGMQRPSGTRQARLVSASAVISSPTTAMAFTVADTVAPSTRAPAASAASRPLTAVATTTTRALASATTVAPEPRPWLAELRTTAADGTSGTGLAVAVRGDGYLLASATAVAGKTSIAVTLPGRAATPARVAGVDADTGTAVLQIDANNLAVAPIGSALGLTADSSMAVLDYFGGHRATLARLNCDGKNTDGSTLRNQLCVHAAAALGSALLQGDQLVGLVTAPGGDEDAVLAVPVDIAMASADSINRTGSAHRPWFGIAWSEDLHITKVEPDSPAAQAGLAVDDVVVAVGAHGLKSSGQLIMCVWSRTADTPLTFTVERDGSRLDLQVTPRVAP
ncbi:MAG: protease Do, partial [Acidimicrobiia bacterium]|nr:protease Do [Acidimicrobiia bacterium]